MTSFTGNLEIRRMVAGDLTRVMEIAESLPGAPHWPKAAYIAALDPKSTPQRIAVVASEAGTVCGFAVAGLVPPQAELETIAVAAECQRRRMANRLFGALAHELHVAGVHEILLEVRFSNQGALGFYRSMGFKETGSRPAYYADPIEDAALLRLSLG
jgi:ribosomal-protein-alanine N-acetyltransferase